MTMLSDADVDDMIMIYNVLQELMQHHLEIDDLVKTFNVLDTYPNGWEQIESHSTAIIEGCGKIEKKLISSKKDRQFCCCQN